MRANKNERDSRRETHKSYHNDATSSRKSLRAPSADGRQYPAFCCWLYTVFFALFLLLILGGFSRSFASERTSPGAHSETTCHTCLTSWLFQQHTVVTALERPLSLLPLREVFCGPARVFCRSHVSSAHRSSHRYRSVSVSILCASFPSMSRRHVPSHRLG